MPITLPAPAPVQPLLFAWLCTSCTFDARESFTRADQHEHETRHIVVLTEVDEPAVGDA